MKKIKAIALLGITGAFISCTLGSVNTTPLVTAELNRSSATVSTVDELKAALTAGAPGDTILLEPGTYTTTTTATSAPTADGDDKWSRWYFRCEADGTADAPITLKSSDPDNPAVISGAGWNQSGYTLYITGDYWIIEDLIITEGQKGIIVANSNHSILKSLEIHEIAQEGIHLLDGSSYTTIEGVNIHDVGKNDDGYGEGIYIGSDNGVWWEGDGVDTGENGLYYHREVMNTHVTNCIIGPNITAEPFDIKEGSHGTIVEYCTIYGTGISGTNFADSHIDIKGYETIIRYNNFYQNENSGILRSIMIVPRISAGVDAELTAHTNYIHDNFFSLYTDDVEVAVANSGSENNYAWDNIRSPEEGNYYGSRLIEEIPEGYDYDGIDINHSPNAEAGEDQELIMGSTVTLDGSASSDLDQDELTYQWSQESGETVDLMGTDSSVVEFTAEEAGEYTFSLTVSDGELSDSDSVTITITEEGTLPEDYITVESPFSFDGVGSYKWRTETIDSYINSWCLDSLTVNGVDITNSWTSHSSLPEKIDGYYNIEYTGSYDWSHIEVE